MALGDCFNQHRLLFEGIINAAVLDFLLDTQHGLFQLVRGNRLEQKVKNTGAQGLSGIGKFVKAGNHHHFGYRAVLHNGIGQGYSVHKRHF